MQDGPQDSLVDAYVQQKVARTNGNLYLPLVGKLPRYPIPKWPGPPGDGRLLLDIGCGWGRWMASAARAGYVPVGVDVQLEHLQAARRVLASLGLRGHFVGGDLAALPFRASSVDFAFSYSVLQHAHKDRARQCLERLATILKPGAQCMIELPLRPGLTNWRHRVDAEEDADPESWSVRYYGWREVEELFQSVFGNVRIESDCFFGIGVQAADLDLMPWRHKAIVMMSELLRRLPMFTRLSDSIYACAHRQGTHEANEAAPELCCPVSGGELEYNADRTQLLSRDAGLAFPVIDGIPMLISSLAQSTR